MLHGLVAIKKAMPLKSCILYADIVTGKAVQELHYHREIVRDLSWHPHLPMMVTSAFDGSVVQWDPQQSVDEDAGKSVCTKRRRQLPEPGDDRLEDCY